MIEEVREEEQKREEIKLGTRTEKKSEKPQSPLKKQRVIEELD